MYSDRVDVLHIAYRYRRVVCVAHNLIFDLFISLYALFYKHLMRRRELKRVFHDLAQLLLVVGKAAAGASEGKGRAQNDRISDFLSRLDSLLDRVRDNRREHRLAYAFAKLLEKLSVLRLLDAFAACSEQFQLALFQNPFFFKLHCKVQSGLTSDARQKRVRTLVSYYLCDIFKSHRLHVYLVRDRRIGHYRRGVGVYEHNLVALLLERKARLRSGIVKFGSLAYDDRSGAYNKDLFYIGSLRHSYDPPSLLQ